MTPTETLQAEIDVPPNPSLEAFEAGLEKLLTTLENHVAADVTRRIVANTSNTSPKARHSEAKQAIMQQARELVAGAVNNGRAIEAEHFQLYALSRIKKEHPDNPTTKGQE